jgi:spermidine synthase
MLDTTVANRNTYIALFLITMSILMNEILLTRIFSVITYYHFAFMAISIVMFGMAVGAMLVFLLPQYQQTTEIHVQLANTALLFSITIVLSFFVLAAVPINFQGTLNGLLQSIAIFCLLAVPFIFGGMNVCLVLTKFTKQINSLYAADLIGAGIGCIMIIVVLNYVTGPIAVVVSAFIGLLSTAFYTENAKASSLKVITFCSMVIFIGLIVFNSTLEFFNISPLRLSWVKNHQEAPLSYEKWNSFSRITLEGNPDGLAPPFTQGLSSVYSLKEKAHGMHIIIDASASTYLMNYHNDPKEIEFLKYDMTGFANYLKADAKMLIIGVGGGRDVLTALAFKQRAITGIEVNPIIIDLLKNQYNEFSGQLYNNPKVKLINAEARSFAAQSKDKFDIIQIPLIDTWAATAAGAYALSENALYTTQAWQTFIAHLNPNGILTVTRWYTPKSPAELYRLTALASKSLQQMGVADPASHIMIFSSDGIAFNSNPNKVYVGNVMVSPTPFTQQTILAAEDMADKLNYSILFTPNHKNNVIFSTLAANQDINLLTEKLGFDMSAPTDDKPFFFEMLKFKKYFKEKLWKSDSYYLNNNLFTSASRALSILLVLLFTVTILTLACLVLPILFKSNKQIKRSAWPFLMYFASIGLGFMFIEIAQLQRFVLFLGPPTYGLSVILFGLLVSSGLGSLFTNNFLTSDNKLILSQLMLLIVVGIFGYVTSDVIAYYQASSIAIRILVALSIIFSLGFFMGSALPLGMQLANRYSSQLTPWLWGINGATSICGSVFAMVIALSQGIQATYVSGLICYSLAFTSIIYIFARQAIYGLSSYSLSSYGLASHPSRDR